MKDTTVVLTISHEGELPKGPLAALEAKAYDFTMAKGVACGEVVAKESHQPQAQSPEQAAADLLEQLGWTFTNGRWLKEAAK